MSKPTAPLAPAETVALYDRLLAAMDPPVERKGAANPYTSLNGHMVSQLTPGGTLALRLPPGPCEEFLRTWAASLLIGPHGRPMANFVAVPAALLEDTAALVPWMQRSIDFVASLKPKPTTARRAPPKRG